MAMERSAHDDGADAAAADLPEQSHLDADDTAGTSPTSAAVAVAGSAANAERPTVVSEAEIAQRASDAPINSVYELLGDASIAEVAEADPLDQERTVHDALRTDFLSEPDPGPDHSVPEPISPAGRTSASDLIAAMVRQAEAQEAAIANADEWGRVHELPGRTIGLATDAPHTSTVWSDVRLDEDRTTGGPAAELVP